MPIHDWSRVNAGTFHDFHTAWMTEIPLEMTYVGAWRGVPRRWQSALEA